MNHFTSPSFWNKYEKLPKQIRELADKNFELLKRNSMHPSLHLKKAGNYWSVRAAKKHRALAVEMDEGFLWFWIGAHDEYMRILKDF